MIFGFGKGNKEKPKPKKEKRQAELKMPNQDYKDPDQWSRLLEERSGESSEDLRDSLKTFFEGMADMKKQNETVNREEQIQRPPGYNWKNKAK